MNSRKMKNAKKISSKVFHIVLAVTLSLVMIPSGAFVNVGKAFADQNEALVLPGMNQGTEEATEPEVTTPDPEVVAEAPASPVVANPVLRDANDIKTWGELQTAITNAGTTETTIQLTQDLTATDSDAWLVIGSTQTITIDLNGFKLDRNLQQTGEKEDGAAIRNEGKLTIINSGAKDKGIITGGYMNGAGGGISSVGYYLSVENCTIKENYARNGAGIGIYNSGIEGDFTLDLNNCDICNNHVTTESGSGGGLYIRGTSTNYKTNALVKDCNISNNVTLCGLGSGIYWHGTGGWTVEGSSFTVTNTNIENNHAEAAVPSYDGNGAGVCLMERNQPTGTPISFNSCIISGNGSQSRGNGGGLYAEGSSSGSLNLSLNGCIICDNVIKKGTENDYGGAGLCLVRSDAKINNCAIARNKAYNTNGGAISIPTVSNSTITLNNSKLYNNWCSNEGSAIYEANIDDATSLEITGGSEIFGNSCAEDSTAPSAVCISKKFSLTNGKIYGNSGRGVYVSANSNVADAKVNTDFYIYDNYLNGTYNETTKLYEKGFDGFPCNLFIANDVKIIVEGTLPPSEITDNNYAIGVTTVTAATSGTSITFTGTLGGDYSKKFKADKSTEGNYVNKEGNVLKLNYIDAWDQLQKTLNREVAHIASRYFFEYVGIGTQDNPLKIKLVADMACTNQDDGPLSVTSLDYTEIDLNGHKLDRNLDTATANGYVITTSKNLTINDSSGNNSGVITGGNCGGDAGVGGIYCTDGTLIFNGGHIYNCVSEIGFGEGANGGGICCTGSATFTMTEGRISHCKATMGAGIFLNNSGENNISGGMIDNNFATQYGGGLALFGTEYFTMSGGSICNNSCLGAEGISGAGMIIYGNATFQEALGKEIKIFGNTSVHADHGAGIAISCGGEYDSHKVNLNSGKVYGNDGSGVFVLGYSQYSNTTLNPAKFKIFNNYLGGSFDEATGCYVANEWSQPCNLEINNGKYEDLDGMIRVVQPLTATDNVIGVSTANNLDNDPYVFTTRMTSADVAKYFKADDESEQVEYFTSGEETYMQIAKFNPWFGLQQALAGNNPGFAYSQYFTVDDSGIKLMQDITCTDQSFGPLEVPENTTATIDLNGYKLDRALTKATSKGSVISVDGELTINDSSETKTGKITGGWTTTDGGGIDFTGASLNINGGSICDCKAENKGGGIFTYANANVTMNGGRIIGNTAGQNGGGIYVNATFVMNSGDIIYNTAENGSAGGYYCEGAWTIKIWGGNIKYNTSKEEGAGITYSQGVYVGGTLNISDNVNNGEVVKDNLGNYKLNGGTYSNVWVDLQNADALYLGEEEFVPQDGMKVGITIDPDSREFAEAFPFVSCDYDYSKYFFADNSAMGDWIEYSDGLGLMMRSYDSAWTDLNSSIIGSTTASEGIFFTHDEQWDANYITLLGDIKCLDPNAGPIVNNRAGQFPIVLDLNGHTLDRGLTEATENGCVINNLGTLTICDSSASQTGKITGGFGNGVSGDPYNCGGGIQSGSFDDENAKLIFDSGSIIGCSSNVCGGGILVQNGSFLMKGGVISDCVASDDTYDGYGGGLAITKANSATIEGGIIENNYGHSGGGGICLYNVYALISGEPNVDLTLNITGATIRNNSTNYNESSMGAGILCLFSTLNLKEDVAHGKHINIYGNNTCFGGGITVYVGHANFESGSIYGNNGSGLCVFGLYDPEPYGGLCNEVTLNSDFIIKDNYFNGIINEETGLCEKGDGYNCNLWNFDLENGKINVVGSQFTQNKIGVYVDDTPTSDEPVPFTEACSKNYSNVFVSDRADEGEWVSQNATSKCMQVNAYDPWTDLNNVIGGTAPTGTTYQKWFTYYGDKTTPQGLTIVLRDDIVAPNNSSNIFINSGEKVTIDLNGHKLDRGLANAELPTLNGLIIKNAGDLTILDSSESHGGLLTGAYYSGNGGAIYTEGTSGLAKLTLKDITIANNKANKGGGVFVERQSDVHLTNVTIKDNFATTNGGGLGMAWTSGFEPSNLTVDNCVIENNSVGSETAVANPQTGGGCYLEGSGDASDALASVVFNDTVIKDNKTNNENTIGAGMYVEHLSTTFNNCDFVDNHSAGEAGGCAIYSITELATELNETFNGGTFVGNVCDSNDVEDDYLLGVGGLGIQYNYNVFINGTEFADNYGYYVGAISNNSGNLTITGGTSIHDNSYSVMGYETASGLYSTMENYLTNISLIKGEIYNNVGDYGVALFGYSGEYAASVSRTFVIKDNVDSSGANKNLGFSSLAKINILDDTSNARNKIGISYMYAVPSAGFVFANNVNHEYLKEYFVADDPAYGVVYNAETKQLLIVNAPPYTITYCDQGHTYFSGTHGSGYPQIHNYGTDTNLVEPSRTGYSFGGWFTNSGCTGEPVTTLGAYDYTGDIKLYAKWNPVAPGRIDFKLQEYINGANGGPTLVTYHPVFNTVPAGLTFYDANDQQITSMSPDIAYAKVTNNNVEIKTVRAVQARWDNTYYFAEPPSTYPVNATGIKDTFITSNLVGGNQNTEEACWFVPGDANTGDNPPMYNDICVTDIWNVYKSSEFGGDDAAGQSFWACRAYKSNEFSGWRPSMTARKWGSYWDNNNNWVMISRVFDVQNYISSTNAKDNTYSAARGQSSIDSGANDPLGSEFNGTFLSQGDTVSVPLVSEIAQAEADVVSPSGVVAAVQNWFAAAVDSASPFAVYIIIGLVLASLAGCGFVFYRIRKRD